MIKKLATIGNSYGVIIDRPLLREAGIEPDSRIELMVVEGSVVIRPAPAGTRRPHKAARRSSARKRVSGVSVAAE